MCAQIESLHYLLKKFDLRYSYQESSERLLLSGQSLKPIAAQLLDRFSEFITLLPHQQSKSPLNTENYEKSNGAFDKGKILQSLAVPRDFHGGDYWTRIAGLICQVFTPIHKSLYLQRFPALHSGIYSQLKLSKIHRLREKQGKTKPPRRCT